MGQVGWLVQDSKGEYREVEHERLLRYARQYPSNFHFTPEMLEGMFQAQERDYMSPTMLTGCPREVVLRRTLDYYVPLEYAWPAYRGTIGHAIMEKSVNETDALLEQRLSCEFVLRPSGETVTLRGTPDKVLPTQKLLVDYKTVKELESSPKNYWIAQLSAYRWMLKQHGIEIERALIQQIGMMSPRRLEIQLWSLEHTERWLNARIYSFKGAFDGEYSIEGLLPPPVDYLTEPDVAWRCYGKNGKPAWCAMATPCAALWKEGK